jgi:hypothetical protein
VTDRRDVMPQRPNFFGTYLARLAGRADRIGWANLVEDTKAMWEPMGYRVHVDTNQQRVVITAKAEQ